MSIFSQWKRHYNICLSVSCFNKHCSDISLLCAVLIQVLALLSLLWLVFIVKGIFSHGCCSHLRVLLQCLCVRQEFPWGQLYGHTCSVLINHYEKHKDFTDTKTDFACQRDKRKFQLLVCHTWSLLIKQQTLLQVLNISAVSLNLLERCERWQWEEKQKVWTYSLISQRRKGRACL